MSEVTFLCDDGDTSNAKQWTRDGQPLLPSDRIAFLENNRILMLKGVNRTDTAEYRCNVSNLSDHEVGTCQLTVYCKYCNLNCDCFRHYIETVCQGQQLSVQICFGS